MKRFADIRGHEGACAFLRGAVANRRLAHALVFAGPEGIGKRAVALALAGWLQCAAGGEDACGECPACRQIAAGSHPDVVVVTIPAGKKEIGVDRARELKRFTQMRPVSGSTKLALVDDAHMLTVAAQNALLKTLEEPPASALLILITANPDALLPTVRSRCQRVQFGALPADAVADVLVTQHGWEPDTARTVAASADGSVGRALALGRSFGDPERSELTAALATLQGARYVRVAQMAHDLNHPESETRVKLEGLLYRYRDEVLRLIGAEEQSHGDLPAGSVRVALQRVDAVREALAALQRGNANRQLLLESLLLRLAET
jgi:DNA polymerase-3 subunit delta'